MTPNSLIIVALGGNAISRTAEEGNVAQQFTHCAETARQLADLIERGHQLVITHGNGPQIGNFMLRNEVAAGAIYPLPMEVAVAHVQGGMGFMIAQSLTNELTRRDREQIVSAIITTVLVDAADPAFANPAKPVGKVLSKKEADYHREEGWHIKEVSGGQFRRVVPSPLPQRIMEIDAIRRSVDAGDIIVACGGGGIPVVRKPYVGLRGIAAVIDKDLASALLAVSLNADTIMFLTDVQRVAINFAKPDQREIDHMTIAEAEQWLTEGQFPPGSMGPKIQAAVSFLTASPNPNARVIVAPLEGAADAITNNTGTHITKS